ncbi:WD repeat-containing protein 6 [Gnomoniopsis sp. IMI 355080]|nr:WD repeat-containing protein 6 [Gnomoniopsis sp. IMI 355080]
MTLHHASPTALQRAHIHSPITALAFYSFPGNDTSTLHLLSGQDTHLHIHTTNNYHQVASIEIFLAQPIQGISTSVAGDVLLWGGPWLALLTHERITQLISQQQPAALEGTEVLRGTDWIYHASLASPTLAAVVTAHNEVFPLHITRTPGAECMLRWGRVRAPPSSRPILYAARLEHVAEGEVLVAAGTVFGEIVVWRCRVDEEMGTDGAVEVLYVFTGHEGSIFGVDISPAMTVAGNATRLLASCSDDRTIRVWDISDSTSAWTRLPTDEKNHAESRSFPEARETGFGENGVLDLGAQAGCVSSEPIAMAMGHVSRIWDARFAPCTPPGGAIQALTVYSFGEDATAQRWRLDLNELVETASVNGSTKKVSRAAGFAASLTHEAILHRHSGKHIWSSAILQPTSADNKTLIVTGGSDGKINLVEEISPTKDTRSVMLDISGTEVVRCFPDAAMQNGHADALPRATQRKKSKLEEEPFLMYALLTAESAIATTSTGRIFSGLLLRGSELSWSEVGMPQGIRNDLRQYQIVRSAGTGIALLGSTSGSVYLYRDGAVEQVCKLPRKISDIFTVPVNDLASLGLGAGGRPSSLLPIIVSTMGSSQVTFLVLNLTASGSVIQQEHPIELEAGFIPTAIGCCGGCLVFGSRNGALMVYKPSHNGETTFERATRIERPFTKDAVSSITPLPPKDDSPAPYFLTTSRDGRYRIYEISTTSSVQVELRHEAVPPLGPMIESAVFTPSTPSHPPELILAGFRSKYFIVWNETRQVELANVECGGAFRSFTHRVDSAHPANVAFIWTRASRTCVYSQTELSQRVLKPGGHGREIKAVAASDAAGLLATGAEDTTVQIWTYHADDKGRGTTGLTRLAVIEKHTAGIQSLKWASAKYLLSSSGNEELYIWRVTRLDESAYEGLAVVGEGVYPDKTRDGDLRIMSFDVEVLAPQDTCDEVLCLSLVLSNSTLRTYRYCKTDGFALLAEGRYTGACLMQIRHLRVAEAGEEVQVLTAATDGNIALWNMSMVNDKATKAVYELVEVVGLHQSGIKSLDVRSTSQDGYIVVTGGDDNALGHMLLVWSSARSCYMVGSRSLANGAHAAAVTGLCITGVDVPPDQSGRIVRVCTASNDQRVKSWRIVLGRESRATRVKLVQDRYSAIADCGDLETLKGGRYAVVVGVGMEFWDLPSN